MAVVRIHSWALFPRIIAVVACLVSSPAVLAEACAPATRVKSLFLTETVDRLPVARLEASLAGMREQEGDADIYQLDVELGFSERVQLKAEWDERRLPDGMVDHALTASAAYELVCRSGLPVLRLYIGFHHNGGNGPIARLLAGQRIGYVSWQAGITRNNAVDSVRYTGSLLFDDLILPLAFEAVADDAPVGWERWYGVALFLVAGTTFDLGLGYAIGSGLGEGETRAMLRATFTF